jgi:hexosaminidase
MNTRIFKRLVFLCISMWVVNLLEAQLITTPTASDLIPKPLHYVDNQGVFILSPSIKIYAPAEFSDVAQLLSEQLNMGNPVVKQNKGASIIFLKSGETDYLGTESYKLNITPDRVAISAFTRQGAIRALFTLVQLQLLQADMSKIPCTDITDSPRFSYRGMHLDVSRNFFPVSFIKKYLDMMALYKYNTFHWHLTDGPGWRLEIKKYPELTAKAAFRTENTWKEWWNGTKRYSDEGNPNAYGGYYTQKDAKEIVAYAARRGITVIPEIEMPGHSEEVLAIYPEFSCSGKPYMNSEFCIGNPQTFIFLENVLTEVMEIFPSTYIHVGGDEANTKPWAECTKCQMLKKEKGLKNEHELQSYLIKHMEEFLKAHGRKLLGWDEIVDGGLPADATVMSWRGMNGGIKAVQQGHDVVMTPGETYLDAYQSDPATQPQAIGGFLPISRVYNFEPVPEGLSSDQIKHILGTQANLWTEYMPTTYQVEYMSFPRALALAEVAWSKKEYRNFDDFHRRLQAQYRLLQRENINYCRPSTFLTVFAQPDYEKKQDKISFESEQYRPEIRFTLDGSIPTIASTLYEKPFYTSGKTEIKAAVFSKGEMTGMETSYTADYHRAIGKKVLYNQLWSDAYPAQKEQTLTNGVKGSLTYTDKQWLGYLSDFDVIIDMDSIQSISSVAIRFMHQPGPGVYLPSDVKVQFSDDGKTFNSFQKQTHNIQPDNPALIFKTFTFDCVQTRARYIRIIAPNVMKGFMFVDEIIVY